MAVVNYTNTLNEVISNSKDTYPLSSALTGTFNITSGSTQGNATGGALLSEAKVGGWLYDKTNSEIRRITSISDNNTFTIDHAFSNAQVGTTLYFTPDESLVEISIAFVPSNGIVNNKALVANLGFSWGKSSRSTSGDRDFVDPIIVDATGTVAYIQALK